MCLFLPGAWIQRPPRPPWAGDQKLTPGLPPCPALLPDSVSPSSDPAFLPLRVATTGNPDFRGRDPQPSGRSCLGLVLTSHSRSETRKGPRRGARPWQGLQGCGHKPRNAGGHQEPRESRNRLAPGGCTVLVTPGFWISDSSAERVTSPGGAPRVVTRYSGCRKRRPHLTSVLTAWPSSGTQALPPRALARPHPVP